MLSVAPNKYLLDDDGGVDGRRVHDKKCFCKRCRQYGRVLVNRRYDDTPAGRWQKIEYLHLQIIKYLPDKLRRVCIRTVLLLHYTGSLDYCHINYGQK